MTKYISDVKELGSISKFPEFSNTKVYMLPFYKSDGLPVHLSKWQSVVDEMLKDINTTSKIYLMIDESFVAANTTHRRPGLHIDGYWVEGVGHGSSGGNGGHKGDGESWHSSKFQTPEALLLTSNVQAARSFVGTYSGVIGDMGDCSHINTDTLTEVNLQANKVYAGNVTMLHESLPVTDNCYRTVVRLNVPGFSLGVTND